MAVADVYDALVSRRTYKEGLPHEQAMAVIVAGRGTQFDPDIVDAFVAMGEEIEAIAELFRDSDETLARKAADLKRYAGDAG
jgi:putative two-component system response regulator